MRLLLRVLHALLPVLLLLTLAELGLWFAGIDAPPLGDAGFSGARLMVSDDHELDVCPLCQGSCRASGSGGA